MVNWRFLSWYENEITARVRMEKWPWAARFFKTRSLALGHASSAGWSPTDKKPRVRARSDSATCCKRKTTTATFQVEVVVLSERRGPAAIAHTLCGKTEESRELRLKVGGGTENDAAFRGLRESKPSKRDRLEIGRLGGRVQPSAVRRPDENRAR
jgi:ribosome-associated heat shock protein Hsp15